MNRKLWENIISLYGVQIFTYLIPLATLPFLTHVLGTKQWGALALADAYASYLSLFVEYGFGLSASREIARNRENPKLRAAEISGVLGAQALLILVSVLTTILFFDSVPALTVIRPLLPVLCVLGLARALSPIWYFQGLEKMRFIAALTVLANAASAIAVFSLIRSPNDGWISLAARAFAAVFVTALTWLIVLKENPVLRITIRGSLAALRDGGSLFLFKSAISFYTTANVLILGLFAAPSEVAIYAGAEKLARAATAGIQPISQSFYPRLSHLIGTNRPGAAQTIKVSAALIVGLGLAIGIGVCAAAPIIVRVSLGAGFERSVPVLRVLALLVPIVALSNVLGIQWMLALKMDAAFNKIILAAGATNIVLASFLARRLGPMGMAASVVAADTVVTLGIIVVLCTKKQHPWSIPMQEQSLSNVA